MQMDDVDVEEQEAGAPAWVVTFGDMMSLLLTFFVMLLSFSDVDKVAFAQIMGSLKDAFGVQTLVIETNPVRGPKVMPVHIEGNASGEGLLDRLNSIMPGAFAGGDKIKEGEAQVTVSFPGKVLFPSGEAELNPAFLATLDAIAALMKEDVTLNLKVFGHTDSRPINTPRFRSNWELSGARASSVITELIGRGLNPRRLMAVGFSDSRPVAPNDSAANREKNRRVEFLFILDQDGTPGFNEEE